MPSYKLYYFNLRARAELTRLIFAATNTPYEDIRITNWAEQKSSLSPPFGQLPVLEVDGVKLCQSLTIARFVARKTGLAGDNELEEARADMVVDCVKDLFDECVSIIWDKDPARKEERTKLYNEEKLPQRLGYLEKILDSNGDWFVGKKLTWADLAQIDLYKFLESNGHPIPWPAIPKLKAHRERVETLPFIAAYLASRPDVTR